MPGRVGTRLNPKPVPETGTGGTACGSPAPAVTGECVRNPFGGRIGRPTGSVANVNEQDAKGQVNGSPGKRSP